MTIHHDKLAYGKIAPVKEDIPEDELARMIKELNLSDDGSEPDKEAEDKKEER